MPIASHATKAVQDFLAAIRPLRPAYSDPTFSYLAVRTVQGWLLLKGQLSLNLAPSKVPFNHFTSENVRAGHCHLSDIAGSPEEFLQIIEGGKIRVGTEDLLFPPGQNGTHGAYFQPLHPAGLQNQNRLNVLGIVGSENAEVNRTLHLDWEVRAAATPYDGLQDLASEFQVGIVRTDAISIEVAAYNVAAFDLTSAISGTKAKVGLRLAKGAKFDDASLGYRVLSQGKVTARGLIPGKDFKWSESADHRQGWAQIEVPPAAVVHGIANYAGVAQHQGWAIDPDAVQNPLRAVYETFDKALRFLQEVLNRETKSGNSRDLEAVLGWLLWMLGFGVANLGGTAKTQDAPDLLCTTPSGNLLIVEVTTGLLRADNKLTNLHDRTQAIRRSLDASGNSQTRILPLLVTSKTQREIEPELEQAERWGIKVVTKDDFDATLVRTLVLSKPDQLFEELEKSVRDARAKFEQLSGGAVSLSG